MNENACEMFMNDVMEEECFLKCQINSNLQIKNSENLESKKRTVKKISNHCMFKEQFGTYMVKKIYVGLFYVNDNKNVDMKCPQTMKCILCYNNIIFICNLQTQARKNLILSNTINGITTLKHVNVNHSNVEEEMNNPLRREVENNLPKRDQIHLAL